MENKYVAGMIVLCVLSLMLSLGCLGNDPKSASGVSKATVKVPTGSDGLTVEQRNIVKRLAEDNAVGSIKHLYVISAYSGQVIMYSTVDGKVTSSGKRLNPYALTGNNQYNNNGAFGIDIGGTDYATSEVLQDDGTYGSSAEYIYWWDSKGIYHQLYPSGGMIIQISSEPIAVKSIILNLEIQNSTD